MKYIQFNPLNPEPYYNLVSDDDKKQQKVITVIMLSTFALIAIGSYVDWRRREREKIQQYLTEIPVSQAD